MVILITRLISNRKNKPVLRPMAFEGEVRNEDEGKRENSKEKEEKGKMMK
jgi:hypothetical protein